MVVWGVFGILPVTHPVFFIVFQRQRQLTTGDEREHAIGFFRAILIPVRATTLCTCMHTSIQYKLHPQCHICM